MKKIEPKGLSGINSLIYMRGPSEKATRINAELDDLRAIGLDAWMAKRGKSGLSGKNLAEAMGLAESTISEIRNGVKGKTLRPTHYILIRGLLNEGRI